MVKRLMLAATLLTVFSAGIVSARQLFTSPGLFPFCRGTCSATVRCSGPCICNIQGTTGVCTKDPLPLKPLSK